MSRFSEAFGKPLFGFTDYNPPKGYELACCAGLLTERANKPVEPRIRGYTRLPVSNLAGIEVVFGPYASDTIVAGVVFWDRDERPVYWHYFRNDRKLRAGVECKVRVRLTPRKTITDELVALPTGHEDCDCVSCLPHTY